MRHTPGCSCCGCKTHIADDFDRPDVSDEWNGGYVVTHSELTDDDPPETIYHYHFQTDGGEIITHQTQIDFSNIVINFGVNIVYEPPTVANPWESTFAWWEGNAWKLHFPNGAYVLSELKQVRWESGGIGIMRWVYYWEIALFDNNGVEVNRKQLHTGMYPQAYYFDYRSLSLCIRTDDDGDSIIDFYTYLDWPRLGVVEGGVGTGTLGIEWIPNSQALPFEVNGVSIYNANDEKGKCPKCQEDCPDCGDKTSHIIEAVFSGIPNPNPQYWCDAQNRLTNYFYIRSCEWQELGCNVTASSTPVNLSWVDAIDLVSHPEGYRLEWWKTTTGYGYHKVMHSEPLPEPLDCTTFTDVLLTPVYTPIGVGDCDYSNAQILVNSRTTDTRDPYWSYYLFGQDGSYPPTITCTVSLASPNDVWNGTWTLRASPCQNGGYGAQWTSWQETGDTSNGYIVFSVNPFYADAEILTRYHINGSPGRYMTASVDIAGFGYWVAKSRDNLIGEMTYPPWPLSHGYTFIFSHFYNFVNYPEGTVTVTVT